MNYTGDSANKIKESGRLAFRAGIPREDCPCSPQSSAWRAWRSGWNEGAHEWDKDKGHHQERIAAARAVGEELI